MKTAKTFKKHVIFSLIALMALMALISLLSREKEKDKEPIRIDFVMTVNDSWRREITTDTPLYIQCSVTNSMEGRDMPLSIDKSVKPIFTNQKNKRVNIKTRMLPLGSTRVPPLGELKITWIAESKVPEGSYSVTLPPPSGLIKTGRHTLKNIKVSEAELIVTSAKISDQAKEYYARRLLAIEEKHDELIEKLKATIADDPDNILMRAELVDAYENAGEYEKAYDEIIGIGFTVQEAAKKDNPSETAPEVPCWIPLRAGELKSKMAKN